MEDFLAFESENGGVLSLGIATSYIVQMRVVNTTFLISIEGWVDIRAEAGAGVWLSRRGEFGSVLVLDFRLCTTRHAARLFCWLASDRNKIKERSYVMYGELSFPVDEE